MTFLQPELLFGLPLLLVPIVIHLLNRRRYKIEDWGAMQFLVQATRASTSKAKLKQILILAMRTLVVLMLIFFLSRPLVGGWVGKLGGGKPDTVFVVIDRSASMEAGKSDDSLSLKEKAAQSFLDAFALFKGSSKLVFVDSVSGDLIPLEDFETIRTEWLSEITDTTVSMPLLFLQMLDWIEKNSVGVAEVWIASDLQSSNWQFEDNVWDDIQTKFSALPQKVSFKILSVQSVENGNIGVWSDQQMDQGFGHSDTIPLRFQFIQNGNNNKEIPIEINSSDSSFQSQVSLSGSKTVWRQTLGLSGGGTLPWISVSIPDDSNAQDNHYYSVIPQPLKPRVLIVAENDISSEILKAAVKVGLPPESPIDLKGSLDEAPESDTAMILWQGRIPTNPSAQYLSDFVEGGGTVLFLPSSESRMSSQNIFGSSWGETQSPADQESYLIANWDQQSGPVAKTAEGFSLPLDRNSFFQRRELISSGSPVVSFTDQSPFLIQTRNGKGRTYWISTLPNSDWSTLGQGFSFVPILQRMVMESSQRFIEPVQLEAGRLNIKETGLDVLKWEPVVPDTPGRNPLLQSGIYKQDDKYIAVNIPSEEMDTYFYTLSDVESRLEELSISGVTNSQVGIQGRQESDTLQSELWKWFLIVMVVFLGVESFLTLPDKMTPSERASV